MDDVMCPECSARVPAVAKICPICGCRIQQSALAPSNRDTLAEGIPSMTAPTSDGHRSGGDPFAVGPLTVDLHCSSSLGERAVNLHSADLLEIGREVGPLTDLCTDNVSGRHAEIRIGHDCVEIRDTGRDGRGSTNGTYVDGVRIPPGVPTALKDGAVVTCGTDPPLTITISVAPQ